MYIFDLSDIMLFIKSYKTPHAVFDITNHVSFATGNTWLSIHHKLLTINVAFPSYALVSIVVSNQKLLILKLLINVLVI